MIDKHVDTQKKTWPKSRFGYRTRESPYIDKPPRAIILILMGSPNLFPNSLEGYLFRYNSMYMKYRAKIIAITPAEIVRKILLTDINSIVTCLFIT